ncbi:MAG: LysR family transcriptional regulator [Oceanicoccus sp.]|uniref:LysR family transcriptional regulator n=1 Tax=Oceanicoccus sp. TaxID=2691044 RepID=UPI002638BCA5|nr:LysR family transcriptional regulator [Oceanicoccus sp.]MDG1772821.1 LysR family transcriptional regulator [Oceanicoccus sp.]
MNISRIDLNLLVYLDVLLREQNVTKAADQLGITQPAMSNSLRRLRDLFNDPLLIRTSQGMSPTQRAQELQPQVRAILSNIEKAVQPSAEFKLKESDRVFRIMASDYAESTLIPALLTEIRHIAPNIRLDILTPSDVTFQDVEKGKVDMAINRFDYLPQSFHQVNVWRDNFTCLMSKDNPIKDDFTLDSYLNAHHIWVSKTGMGVGVGMNPTDTQRLGWVDEALAEIDRTRHIRVFTRHYQVAALLAEQPDLIATLPKQAALLHTRHGSLITRPPPFPIVPIELNMAWSPLLHHNPGHTWLRRLIVDVAQAIVEKSKT